MRNSLFVGFFTALVLATAMPFITFAQEATPVVAQTKNAIEFKGPSIEMQNLVVDMDSRNNVVRVEGNITNRGTHTGTYRALVQFHPTVKQSGEETQPLFTAYLDKEYVIPAGGVTKFSELVAIPSFLSGKTRMFLTLNEQMTGKMGEILYLGEYELVEQFWVSIKDCKVNGAAPLIVTKFKVDARELNIVCDIKFIGKGQRTAGIALVSRDGMTGASEGKVLDSKFLTITEKSVPLEMKTADLPMGLSRLEVQALDEGGHVLGSSGIIFVSVEGAGGKLLNIGSDKIAYSAGDTARFLVVAELYGMSQQRLDITLQSGSKLCAEKLIGAAYSPQGTIDVPVTRDCPDPVVTAEIVSADGKVVGSLTKRLRGDMPKEGALTGKNLLRLLALLCFLMFAPLVILYMKNYGKKTTPVLTFFLIFLAAGLPLVLYACTADFQIQKIDEYQCAGALPVITVLADAQVVNHYKYTYVPGEHFEVYIVTYQDPITALGLSGSTKAVFNYEIPSTGGESVDWNAFPATVGTTTGSWDVSGWSSLKTIQIHANNIIGTQRVVGNLTLTNPINNAMVGNPALGTPASSAVGCPNSYNTTDTTATYSGGHEGLYEVVTTPNSPPAPTLDPTTQTVAVNTNATLTAGGFNVPGKTAQYEFDWNMDGIPNYISPAVLQGEFQTANYSWATPGTYPVQARTCYVTGGCSTWTGAEVTVNNLNPVNTPPDAPIFTGQQSPLAGLPYDYEVWGTDPDVGQQVRYEIDWNGFGLPDEYVPGINTYVNQGPSSPRVTMWIPNITFNARARTCDDGGLCSSWTVLQVTASEGPACFIHSYNFNPQGVFVPPSVEFTGFMEYYNDPDLDWVTANFPVITNYASLNGGTAVCSGMTCSPYGYFVAALISGDVTRPAIPVGCQSFNTQQPVINSFVATPNSVAAGNPTTLSWNVSGYAPVCTIDQGVGNAPTPIGSKPSGNIFADTTFTLTCTNPWGSATASVLAGLAAGNNAPNAAAGPDRVITLPINFTTPLLASVSDNDGIVSASIWSLEPGSPGPATITDGNTLSPTFSAMDVPGVYTFKLTAIDDLGAMGEDMMTVTVNPGVAPIITSFTATPAIVDYNGQSTLNWTTTGTVTECRVNGSTRASGWTTGPLTQNQTYDLVCYNGLAQSEAVTLDVSVRPQVNATLTVNGTPTMNGSTPELVGPFGSETPANYRLEMSMLGTPGIGYTCALKRDGSLPFPYGNLPASSYDTNTIGVPTPGTYTWTFKCTQDSNPNVFTESSPVTLMVEASILFVPVTSTNDMGQQIVGNPKVVDPAITVQNSSLSTVALNVNTVVMGGAHPGDFSVNCGAVPVVLAPNTSRTCSITFTPGMNGIRQAIVSFTGNNGIDVFTIFGEGIDPVDAAWDTGRVPLSRTRIKSFDITNNGPIAMPDTMVYVSGDFRCSESGLAGTFASSCGIGDLLGGETDQVWIEFTPSAVGSRSINATLSATGYANLPTIPVRGTGVAGTFQFCEPGESGCVQ